ncbi:alpha/beta hydrolase [Sphingomonas panacisoli]|uniref:Alpha/beta hydrolase n=1 Tax=Sphingomonas panacisoli TaxID=1813879 RepID=A0A5B8LFX5_9SPHN|nr:alpha/beta hydrolase [Sphingomonas panacisoli]QDZ06779.1 alpha/beta hydrolase [Sphingomonas panacisoli]
MPDTMHLVDPALRPMLEMWPTIALNAETLIDMRNRSLPTPPIDATGTTLERRHVPGPIGAPDITLHIYKPEDAEGPLPAIYHIHGGGYVGGAASQLEVFHRPLVRALNCVLVSVDYRLAPEHVFPAAIEDCYAGLRWTIEHAATLGIDTSRLGVMGESAGGGLAAALALLVRDRGDYTLAFQHLTYPMIDDRTCAGDQHPHTGEFIWTPHNNHFGWQALLGAEPGGADVSPYAAAARATDLRSLPPTYIMTGALDLFLEEDMDYARRLIRAGVPTELHVYPGGFHGFDIFPGSAASTAAQASRMAALARALA